jgi:hypothetical protein
VVVNGNRIRNCTIIDDFTYFPGGEIHFVDIVADSGSSINNCEVNSLTEHDDFENVGIYVSLNSSVSNSNVENSTFGFIGIFDSNISYCTAENNDEYGFGASTSTVIANCSAEENGFGFYMPYGSAFAINCSAEMNRINGFELGHYSSVNFCVAENNNNKGFSMYGNSTVNNSTAIDNCTGFGLRDNSTVIRSIDIQNNQVTGGQKLVSFKFLADYALNKNLLASFFYDHNSSRFLISTTFPRKSINAGISFRYTNGN